MPVSLLSCPRLNHLQKETTLKNKLKENESQKQQNSARMMESVTLGSLHTMNTQCLRGLHSPASPANLNFYPYVLSVQFHISLFVQPILAVAILDQMVNDFVVWLTVKCHPQANRLNASHMGCCFERRGELKEWDTGWQKQGPVEACLEGCTWSLDPPSSFLSVYNEVRKLHHILQLSRWSVSHAQNQWVSTQWVGTSESVSH